MNLDQLNSLHAFEGVRGAYAALDGIQTERPEIQVAGIALLFTEFCAGLGLDPSALINQAQRRAKDVLGSDTLTHRTEMKSLRAYIQGELRK